MMPYLAVNKDGVEAVFRFKPIRDNFFRVWKPSEKYPFDALVELPKGTIKKIIGRELTWEDEPVKLEMNYGRD